MNCEKCDTENRDDANFCYHCGNPFSRVAPEQPDAPEIEKEPEAPPSPIDETTTEEQFSRILGGRYELKEMLGRGGMGVVYRVYDRQLKMDVAIKFLLDRYVDDPDAVESLRMEAKAAMQLAHPNIVRLYNFEATPHAKYVMMEFIQGESLASIASRKPDKYFTESDVIEYIAKTCQALTYAHGEGIVHRDIKPSNILIATGGQVKLADFGIAYIKEAATSRTDGGGGTPVYMSPEQILNEETDARSDIYSLGITMYEMLAGGPPFRGPDVRNAHIHVVPKPIKGVTDWMNFIVLKCLKKEPDARWASVQELYDVLTRRKEIEVGFQTVFRPEWARAEDERKMTPSKAHPGDLADKDAEISPRERRKIEKAPSLSRSSGSYRIVKPSEKYAKPTHLAPEREQARMGFGILAGILGGLIFAAINRNIAPDGVNAALFHICWIVYGGFIGIAIGIAQKRAAKGLLSCILGITGGFVAALIAGLVDDFPSIEKLAEVPYCMLCGAAIGAFIGIADGFYEMSFSYSARCFAWGAVGGVLAVAAFVVIQIVFSMIWKPYLDWIVMGGTLGAFINICIASAKKPLSKTPRVYGEL